MYMKNGVVGRRRMTATLSAAVMVAPNFVLVRWSTGITLSLSLSLPDYETVLSSYATHY